MKEIRSLTLFGIGWGDIWILVWASLFWYIHQKRWSKGPLTFCLPTGCMHKRVVPQRPVYLMAILLQLISISSEGPISWVQNALNLGHRSPISTKWDVNATSINLTNEPWAIASASPSTKVQYKNRFKIISTWVSRWYMWISLKKIATFSYEQGKQTFQLWNIPRSSYV